MNMTINLILLAIGTIGILLFWLFYRVADSTKKMSEKHVRTQLKDQSISNEQRKTHEQQLSKLLQQSNTISLKVLILIALSLLPLSIILYHNLGTPSAIDYVAQASPTDNPQLSMQDAIAQLEARLAQNPNDVDGQMLYARSQVSLKNYDKAVIAYRKSNELAPNEATILTELAEAIALANNSRSFLGEPEQLLAQAYALDPSNQKAMWLLGITFYEKKDFNRTNELWSTLYDSISDEGAKQQLAQQLVDVRAKLGIDTAIDTQAAGLATELVQLNISLSGSLVKNIEGKNALLYVYAKAATGMPMPIAVIKRPLHNTQNNTANLFPIQVSLSDNNNLQAARKLSSFDEVIVGARISFSGNAIAQTGDLQSTEIKVKISEKLQLELLIDNIR